MKTYYITKLISTSTDYTVKADCEDEAIELLESGEAEEVLDSFVQEVDYDISYEEEDD